MPRPMLPARRPLRRLAPVALAALVIVGAACGGDDAAGSAATTTTGAPTSTLSDAQGSVDEVVPTSAPAALPEPVALDARADFGDGLTATVTEVRSAELQGQLPGELSGPGVEVDLEMTNTGDQPIDLSTVTVDLRDSADVPAYPITTEPASPFSGSVAPGESVSATYLFTIDPADRDDVRLIVVHADESVATVVFSGDLPDA